MNSPEARRHFEARDPYWNDERALGDLWHRGRRYPLQARSHIEEERYAGRTAATLFQPAALIGVREYVQSRLWVPEVPAGFHPVATAQAWHYPADATIVFWELLLQPAWEQGGDVRESHLYRQLWTCYEGFLIERFPTARTVLTTWEDDYTRPEWAGFLNTLGYRQIAPAVFSKDRPAAEPS